MSVYYKSWLPKSLVQTVQKAYKDIIDNDPDFNESQKSLLKEYQNSKLFFYVVTDKIKDSAAIEEIEGNTYEVTESLAKEKDDIQEKADAEVFSPLKNYGTVFENIDDPEVSSKVDLVFDLLGNKVELSNQPEADKTKNNLIKFNQEIEKSSNSNNAGRTWNSLVDEAQRFFNAETVSAATTKNIKNLHSINTKLSTEDSKTIKDAVEDKSLDTIEQREFIARYKNDKNFKTILANSGINKKEIIDSLLAFEGVNKSTFKLMSQAFRENLNLESVKENKELANKYITALGQEPTSMDDRRKFEVLSSIPKEELELVSHKVSKDWKAGTLAKAMSEKFVNIELEHNINHGQKQIINELACANSYLNTITVNTGRQNETLEHLSKNFDSYVRNYNENESVKIEHLKGINENTLGIKANTRAILMNAAQKTTDKDMQAEINQVLAEADQQPMSSFFELVNKKAKEKKEAKTAKQWRAMAGLVAGAAVAMTVAAAAPVALGVVGLGPIAKSLSDQDSPLHKTLSSMGSAFSSYYRITRLTKLSKKLKY